MPDKRRGRLLAELGILVGVFVAGNGCQTSPLTALITSPRPVVRMAAPDPRPDPAAVVLAPQTLLQWTAESTKEPSTPAIQGKGLIDAHGNIDLGEYGMVAVGGKSVQEASTLIAKQLSRHIKGPHVRLRATLGPSVNPVPPAPGISTVRAASQAEVVHTFQPTQAGADQLPPVVKVVGWQPSHKNDAGAQPAVFTTPAAEGAPAAELPAPGAVAGAAPQPGTGVAQTDTPKVQADAPKPAETPKAPAGPEKIETPPTPMSTKPSTPLPVLVAAGDGLGGPPGCVGGLGGAGGAPNEIRKEALPSYMIEPPDILLIEVPVKFTPEDQPIAGQHLVRPDGTVSLGIYGSVFVGGLTLDQAHEVIFQHLNKRLKDFDRKILNVDVLAYNSKVYYVITDGAGNGEQVYRFPITGSETVLDAISQIVGLPPVASKKHIWVARRSLHDGDCGQIMPVDWVGITQHACTASNYQVMPGDRIYVNSDCWKSFDTRVAKVLSPFERMLGFTLLGSSTVNSIKNGSNGSGGNGITR
jgi:polysaccharide export outer membrane protein